LGEHHAFATVAQLRQFWLGWPASRGRRLISARPRPRIDTIPANCRQTRGRPFTPLYSNAGDYLSMFKRSDIVIEKIVARFEGNLHGALEALLLVNEHLEAELHQLYAALADATDRHVKTVH
jgi:hypothetical protein